MVSFQQAPRGWALCDGQLMSISQNSALFSILGTTYGGDGITTFALPDLRGRMPVHLGPGFVQGQVGGEATHTLTVNELPAHVHPAIAQPSPGTVGSPANAAWAAGTTAMYAGTADTAMNGAAIGNAGGGQPHKNQAPYLALNFVIALFGIFPSRS